jgi:hypothetical protein
LVVERVIVPGDEADGDKWSDLEMLVLSGGGRERTELEFKALYEQAGFDLTRIIATRSRLCLIEGIRR